MTRTIRIRGVMFSEDEIHSVVLKRGDKLIKVEIMEAKSVSLSDRYAANGLSPRRPA